jgi:hypothetical protein
MASAPQSRHLEALKTNQRHLDSIPLSPRMNSSGDFVERYLEFQRVCKSEEMKLPLLRVEKNSAVLTNKD